MARRLWRPRPWHRRFIANPSGGSTALIDVLTSLGLTTGLQFALDAGDAASYTSGQKWLDRSGNGQDFFLGADGSATATDPTFNADGSYFSSDGGDLFFYDSTIEPWMDNLHKDGAAFSFLIWAYPAGAGINYLFGTNGGVTTNIGVCFLANSGNGNCTFQVANGTAGFIGPSAFALGASNNAWQCFGMSANEATPTFTAMRNGTTLTTTSAYSSPSASSASFNFGLATNAGDAGASKFPNGARIAMAAFWDSAIGATALISTFNATRGRFGV